MFTRKKADPDEGVRFRFRQGPPVVPALATRPLSKRVTPVDIAIELIAVVAKLAPITAVAVHCDLAALLFYLPIEVTYLTANVAGISRRTPVPLACQCNRARACEEGGCGCQNS
jgi:hypothetical protein